MTLFFTLATLFLAEVDNTIHDVIEDLQLCALKEDLTNSDKVYYSISLLNEIKSSQNPDDAKRDIQIDSHSYSTRNELIYFEETRLYVSKKTRLRVLKEFHDNVATRHLERDKTLSIIKQWFYWSHMTHFVEEYVRTCDACICVKSSHHLSHDELMLLFASDRSWSNITLNFITNLFKSASCLAFNYYDSIIMIVDRFIKMTHYTFCDKKLNSKQFAQLLIRDIIALHDLFEKIISDRRSLFTSHLWKIIATSLSVDYRLLTSFHSQTDDQTKRQNQVLKQYLRCYINFHQNNWVNLLLLSEYFYNVAENATTKTSSFMIYTER